MGPPDTRPLVVLAIVGLVALLAAGTLVVAGILWLLCRAIF